MKKTSLIAAFALSASTLMGLAACGPTPAASSENSSDSSSAAVIIPKTIFTSYQGEAPEYTLVNEWVDLDTFVAVQMNDKSYTHDYSVYVASDDVVVEGHKVAATATGDFDVRVFAGAESYAAATIKASITLKFVDEFQAQVIDFLAPLAENPKNLTIDMLDMSQSGNLSYSGTTFLHNENYAAAFDKTNPGSVIDGEANSFLLVRSLSDGKSYTGHFGEDGKPVFDPGDVTANYDYYYLTGDVSIDGLSTSYVAEDGEALLYGDANFTTNLLTYGASFPLERKGYTADNALILGGSYNEAGDKLEHLYVVPFFSDGEKKYNYGVLDIYGIGTSTNAAIEAAMTDPSYLPAKIESPEVTTTMNAAVTAGNYTVEMNAYAVDASGKKLTPTAADAKDYAYCQLFGAMGDLKMTSYVTEDGIYSKTLVGEKTLDERAYFNRDGKVYSGVIGEKDDSFKVSEVAGATDAKDTADFKSRTLSTVADADVASVTWKTKTTEGTAITFTGATGDNDGSSDQMGLYRNLLKLAAMPVYITIAGDNLSENLTTPVDFDAGTKHSLGLYDNFDSFTVDASNKTIEVSVTAYLPAGLPNGYYHMDFKVSAVGSTAFDFATVVDRAATPVAASSAE